MITSMSENHNQEQPKPFKRSESTAQKILHAPKRAYDWLMHDRFGKEHWFGSTSLLLYLPVYYQNIKAASERKVNGVKDPDKIRITQSTYLAVVSVWSFFAGRGGEIPKGHTLNSRIRSALSHPNRSSSQFDYLLALPIVMLAGYNNIQKGMNSYGVRLKEGKKLMYQKK